MATNREEAIMDKAQMLTEVAKYDRKLENGDDLPLSPIGEKLIERTKELFAIAERQNSSKTSNK